jgi:hypothetical protein
MMQEYKWTADEQLKSMQVTRGIIVDTEVVKVGCLCFGISILDKIVSSMRYLPFGEFRLAIEDVVDLKLYDFSENVLYNARLNVRFGPKIVRVAVEGISWQGSWWPVNTVYFKRKVLKDMWAYNRSIVAIMEKL